MWTDRSTKPSGTLNFTQHHSIRVIPFTHTAVFGLFVPHVCGPSIHRVQVFPVTDENAILSAAKRFKTKVASHLLGFGHDLAHGLTIPWRIQWALRNKQACILTRFELHTVFDYGHGRKIANPIFAT